LPDVTDQELQAAQESNTALNQELHAAQDSVATPN
jgi:chromosome segregation ATPase